MKQMGYFLVFLLLFPLIVGIWVAGFQSLIAMFDPATLAWFGLGLLGAILLQLVTSGVVNDFVSTSAHELSHSAAATLSGRRIRRVRADARREVIPGIGPLWGRYDGETWVQPGSNVLGKLAPYYFPLFTIPFLVIKPIVSQMGEPANNLVDFAIGLTLGFQYVMHAKQFRPEQTDLTKVGYTVSIGTTYTMMLIFLVICVAIVSEAYLNIWYFFLSAATNGWECYKQTFALIRSLIH